MALTVGIDALLARVTARAAAITGIRQAFDYDQWPDSPPAMPREDQAYHLTGYLEEGDGWRYIPRGSDLSEYEFTVPLYTIVVDSAKVKRSRGWVEQYIDSYRSALDSRDAILDVGTGNTGSILYMGGRIVRSIPDWPGYDGFYMLRHELRCHVKGAVSRD